MPAKKTIFAAMLFGSMGLLLGFVIGVMTISVGWRDFADEWRAAAHEWRNAAESCGAGGEDSVETRLSPI
jgi:hypothetical protein